MNHPSLNLYLILLAAFFVVGCGEMKPLPEANTVVMDGPPPDTVDSHSSAAKLVVVINGTSHRGDLEHSH